MVAETPCLAFLEIGIVESGVYRGGVLVTDHSTDPIEFRCTSSIKPNSLQKLLWGKRLASHLLANVLGKPLIDSLSQPVALVVVRQSLLLDLRPLIACPVVSISTKAEHSRCQPLEEGAAGQGNSIYLQVHHDEPSDLRRARESLSPLSRRFDVQEPFSRIVKALADLPNQEPDGSN